MSGESVMVAGRYRLDDRIAVGGMGEVWRAVDTVLGRPVAVKLLRADYAGHAATLARFRAEARHAGSLSHPGIAQVFDYGEAGRQNSPYLVMELVAGPPLTELMASGPLDPARTMDLVAQVAAGLAAAHAAGLVHRDIKPGNLLLAPDGRVKITDFGIAHAAGSAPVTHSGTLIGTPGYLAPERVAGVQVTTASDLYSLGIVAFECLAGAPPFTGISVEVALAHRDQPLPALPATVPPPVTALVTRLTAKDPAARPGGAAEVARLAGRLRDALAASPAAAGGAVRAGAGPQALSSPTLLIAAPSQPPAPTLAAARPAAIGCGPDGPAPGHPQPSRDRAWPARRVALAVAAVAVIAGLAGWLLAAALAAPRPGQHVAAGPSVSARTTPPDMVEVDQRALAGQPVSVVRRQLARLGLRVRVQWRPGGRQPPGTVLSVQPGGRVPAGSVIAVIAAFRAPGHDHHGHDHHNGHGTGNGGSDGGNGD
jgi:serine/threonine-protein kinase